MTKNEFLSALAREIGEECGAECAEKLRFYEEMLEDLMEEGLDEEAAVARLGTPGEIARQIMGEVPPRSAEPMRTEAPPENREPKGSGRRKLRTWEIVVLAAGSPLWVVLLAVAAIILLALCAVLWSLVLAVWAVELSFGVALLAGGIGGGILSFVHLSHGLLLIGTGLVCGALGIPLFFGCLAATRGSARLMCLMARGIRKFFTGGNAK